MRNLLLIALALFIISCGGNTNEPKKEVTITKHGKNISSEGALTADEFLEAFVGKDSMEVKLTAPVGEVCSKKGCWMTMILDDETELFVQFKDYEFFVPKDAGGKMATVEGFAYLDTVSVAEQKHYLEDANASQEEIDAITEPELSLSFEASGVIIKG